MATARKFISGGFGANGIPHAIEIDKSPKNSNQTKDWKRHLQRLVSGKDDKQNFLCSPKLPFPGPIGKKKLSVSNNHAAQSFPSTMPNTSMFTHKDNELNQISRNSMKANTISHDLKEHSFIGKMNQTMKKEFASPKLPEVSKTLRSTLLPHSYNLTPLKDKMMDKSLV